MKRTANEEIEIENWKITTDWKDTTAKHILESKKKRELVVLQDDTLLYDAIEILSYEKILCLPVLHGTKFIGFLDVLNVLEYALILYAKGKTTVDLDREVTQDPKAFRALDEKSETYATVPVRSVLTDRPLKSHTVIQEDTPLVKILERFQDGLHRVIVCDDDDRPIHVITQSDIIKILYHNNHLMDPIALVPLTDVGVANPVSMTVSIHHTVLYAFQTMLGDNVSAVPVVDSAGKMLCNLSASDVKGLGVVCPFSSLLLSVKKFFFQFREVLRPPVVCNWKNWIGTIISKMVLFGIHRVWVVDELEKPTHVVTMTDIISYVTKKVTEKEDV